MSAVSGVRAILLLVETLYLLAFLPAVIRDLRLRIRFCPYTSRTVATCISIATRNTPSVFGGTTTISRCMFSWNLSNGQVIRAAENSWTKPARYDVGDQVIVYYDRNKPRDFRVVAMEGSQNILFHGCHLVTAVVLAEWLLNCFILMKTISGA